MRDDDLRDPLSAVSAKEELPGLRIEPFLTATFRRVKS